MKGGPKLRVLTCLKKISERTERTETTFVLENYARNFENYILEYLTLSILLKSNSFFLRRLACAGLTK